LTAQNAYDRLSVVRESKHHKETDEHGELAGILFRQVTIGNDPVGIHIVRLEAYYKYLLVVLRLLVMSPKTPIKKTTWS
jgi:hypothetical protein